MPHELSFPVYMSAEFFAVDPEQTQETFCGEGPDGKYDRCWLSYCSHSTLLWYQGSALDWAWLCSSSQEQAGGWCGWSWGLSTPAPDQQLSPQGQVMPSLRCEIQRMTGNTSFTNLRILLCKKLDERCFEVSLGPLTLIVCLVCYPESYLAIRGGGIRWWLRLQTLEGLRPMNLNPRSVTYYLFPWKSHLTS